LRGPAQDVESLVKARKQFQQKVQELSQSPRRFSRGRLGPCAAMHVDCSLRRDRECPSNID
jgi:hypothetical protein